MKIEKFEDLEIWQEARELCKFVFTVTSSGQLHKDFRFRDQIRASAGSIMDNIAEGFERGGNKEFVQFLFIAKGSCGEVRSQSYRGCDFTYFSPETLEEILERTDKISGKISRLIQHIKTSSLKGIKYPQ